MSTRRFVWCDHKSTFDRVFGKRDGASFAGAGFYDRSTAAVDVDEPVDIVAPMVMRDIPEHVGPTGRLITSRSEYRDELKRTDCVPRERGLKSRALGYINPEIARAEGKRPSEAAAEFVRSERASALKRAGLA